MSRRTELMIAEDKAKISELLVRGYRSKADIARILNQGREEQFHINASQVTKDINALEQEYLERSLENIEVSRHRALDELYYLLTKCYEGYEKSCINKITLESVRNIENEEEYDEIMEQEEFTQEDLEGMHPFARTAKVKEEFRGEGNPGYITAAKGILDSINKIKNVDGVNKLALTDPSGTQEYTGIAEMMKARMDELSGRDAPTDTDKLLLAAPPEPEPDYIDAEEEN